MRRKGRAREPGTKNKDEGPGAQANGETGPGWTLWLLIGRQNQKSTEGVGTCCSCSCGAAVVGRGVANRSGDRREAHRALRKLDKSAAEQAQNDRKSAAWKVAIAAHWKTTTQAGNRWLSEQLHLGSPVAVSQYVGALRRRKISEAELLKRLAEKPKTCPFGSPPSDRLRLANATRSLGSRAAGITRRQRRAKSKWSRFETEVPCAACGWSPTIRSWITSGAAWMR